MKTKHEVYAEHLEDLKGRPLIGRHTLGDLTLEVTHHTWQVTDIHGNTWSGRARTGQRMRDAIARAVRQWVKKNPQ